MDQAMSIAASSLNAERVAMTATSENVANAQTPGYVDETAQISTLPGGDSLGVGDGVEVTGVSQATNAMLTANNRQAQGALSNLGSLQQLLTASRTSSRWPPSRPPASSTTTNASLSGQLATFWSSWDAIAEAPSSLAPRTEIVDIAQGLVSSLNEAATQLTQLQTNTTEQLGEPGRAGQLLALPDGRAQPVDPLDDRAAGRTEPARRPAQRRRQPLSSLAGVDVRMRGNGTASVSIGGVKVVQGDNAATLSLSRPVASPPSSPVRAASPRRSPAARWPGLLSALNQYLPQYRQQLDSVANALATTVNGQLAAGYNASGTPGTTPLFTGTTAAAGRRQRGGRRRPIAARRGSTRRRRGRQRRQQRAGDGRARATRRPARTAPTRRWSRPSAGDPERQHPARRADLGRQPGDRPRSPRRG